MFDKNPIYSLAFNSSGNRLVSGDKNGTVKIWNGNTYKLIANLKGHTARIVSAAFSPDDSYIATSSYDGTLRIWNNHETSHDPILIKEHESWIFATTFSPDSKKIITSSQKDNLIFIWDSNLETMASEICNGLSRNLNQSEWDEYIGNDVQYQKTCKNIND